MFHLALESTPNDGIISITQDGMEDNVLFFLTCFLTSGEVKRINERLNPIPNGEIKRQRGKNKEVSNLK